MFDAAGIGPAEIGTRLRGGLSPVPDLEALLRMGLAVLCGLAVGLNRAHHGGGRWCGLPRRRRDHDALSCHLR